MGLLVTKKSEKIDIFLKKLFFMRGNNFKGTIGAL
jgi:hypothetical protein